jgi:hypothetical protein
MTRPLFGEFLVEKGLASPETVLSVLIEQIQGQPSVAQIIHQEKLLSESDQLRVLRTQANTGWDYQQAAVSLSLWTPELALRVVQASSRSKAPLGQIMVSRGIINFTELTKALDDYVGMYEGVASATTQTPPPSVPTAMTAIPSSSPSSSPSASPSVPAQAKTPASVEAKIDGYLFPVIDQNLLAEFLEVISEHRAQEVSEITQSWSARAKSGELTTWGIEIKAITRELESVIAAARFVRAETILKLATACSELLAAISGKEDSLLGQVSEIGDGIGSCYRAIGRIRAELVNERCEKGAWATGAGRIEIEGALAKCEVLLAKLAT